MSNAEKERDDWRELQHRAARALELRIAECDRLQREADSAKDLHGALVRIVLEVAGCGPHCTLEFHRWALESVAKIATDVLKRHPEFGRQKLTTTTTGGAS